MGAQEFTAQRRPGDNRGAELALVLAAQSGDQQASSELVRKYRSLVRCKARSYFLVGGDREDVIQEGMIGLFKAIRDYDPDRLSSFRSFAELCVTRQMITAIKTATRRKHAPLNSYVSLSRSTTSDEEGETAAHRHPRCQGGLRSCDDRDFRVGGRLHPQGLLRGTVGLRGERPATVHGRVLLPGDRSKARAAHEVGRQRACSASSARSRHRSTAADSASRNAHW